MGRRNRLRSEAIQRGEVAPFVPKREPKVAGELGVPLVTLRTLRSLGLVGPNDARRK